MSGFSDVRRNTNVYVRLCLLLYPSLSCSFFYEPLLSCFNESRKGDNHVVTDNCLHMWRGHVLNFLLILAALVIAMVSDHYLLLKDWSALWGLCKQWIFDNWWNSLLLIAVCHASDFLLQITGSLFNPIYRCIKFWNCQFIPSMTWDI